jgi:hypothetical protein
MRIFTWLFFATLSIILFLQRLSFNADLKTPATPYGIIGYELAWSPEHAQTIITEWRANDVIETARVRLGIDFAFLLAYPVLLSLGVRLLSGRARLTSAGPNTPFQQAGFWLARGVLVCIPLDIIKNLMLWHMLNVGATGALSHLATACAIFKFLLAGVTILWSLVALTHRAGPRNPVPG